MFSPCLYMRVNLFMHSCIHPFIHFKKIFSRRLRFRFLGAMESERRNTKSYKFLNQAFHDLRSVASLISEPNYFKERYGRLLSLLNTKIHEGLLSTLVQFYDPLYHCFTFPDYQLVPTLEEYSFCIGIPVSDIIPFSGLDEPIKKQ